MPIRWPPTLIRTDVLGEVIDTNNRRPRRDIGRPVHLGPNTYYSFGDTFCHDQRGHFHGVTDSTLAYVPDPVNHPERCFYIPDKDLVDNFIVHTRSEVDYYNDPVNRKENNRIGCGCFGGIVEDWDGSGTGWCFFDKMIWHAAKGGHQFGVGVARVSLNADRTVKFDRVMGDEMLFGTHDARFGSLSALVDDDGWVYLYGSYDPKPGTLDKRVHVARIRRDSDFTRRPNYQFFIKTIDGKGAWADHYKHPDDLKRMGGLDTQLQGGIFKAPAFGPSGSPYIYIGVNKFMAGHFYISSAPSPAGPWVEVADMGELPKDPEARDPNKKAPKYCLYPNPRASDLSRGEIVCTWTDAAEMGGKVIAARFWVEGEYVRGPPPPPPLWAGDQTSKSSGLGGKLMGKLEGLLSK